MEGVYYDLDIQVLDLLEQKNLPGLQLLLRGKRTRLFSSTIESAIQKYEYEFIWEILKYVFATNMTLTTTAFLSLAMRGEVELLVYATTLDPENIILVNPPTYCSFLRVLAVDGCPNRILRFCLQFPICDETDETVFESVIDTLPISVLRELRYRKELAFTNCSTQRFKIRAVQYILFIGTLFGPAMQAGSGLGGDIMVLVVSFLDIENPMKEYRRLESFIRRIRKQPSSAEENRLDILEALQYMQNSMSASTVKIARDLKRMNRINLTLTQDLRSIPPWGTTRAFTFW